jgi:copper-transporting P-type ATPase V
MTIAKICAHCGLALGGPGTEVATESGPKMFCCSGCAFVYQLAGGGEEGDSAESIFLVLLAFGTVLSGAIMTFSWVLYLYPHLDEHLRVEIQYLLMALSAPLIFGLGYPYLKLAVQEIRHLRLSMASLIALGTLAAFFYSARVTIQHGQHVYFDTASMVIVLVTLGKYLHARARAQMAAAMRTLAKDSPTEVRRVRDGAEELVPVAEVKAGDVLRALPAERIVVDGTIREGRTTVDESILTGESLPQIREAGDRVLQGSMNLDGSILYEAVQVGEGTVKAQIERMCVEAIGARMPLASLVDTVSAWFVGSTLLLALGAGLYYTYVRHQPMNGFLNALAVLVVACPCALGIATPMASFVAMQRAAKEGVLIRVPEVLERLRRVDTVVFDKTGTLTEGKLRVMDVQASGESGVDKATILRIAASLENSSEHHLGRAILDAFHTTTGKLAEVEDFRNHPGEGIEGIMPSSDLDGSSSSARLNDSRTVVYAGTAASLEARKLRMPGDLGTRLSDASLESRIYVGWGGQIRGVIRLQDEVRANAKEVVALCRAKGLEVHLLSGDRKESTEQAALHLGIAHWAGEKLPRQKVEYVEELEKAGRNVAMVGDGVNDAPALAKADVGIAHQLGTDLSKEAADVHILAGNLTLVPWSVGLAKRTFRHIQENLFWAFIYNAIAIGLAAAGVLRPILAALAMLLSSLLVVGNSMRLSRTLGVRKEAAPPRPTMRGETSLPARQAAV